MRKLAVLAALSMAGVLVPTGSATAAATCFAPDHTFAERLMHGTSTATANSTPWSAPPGPARVAATSYTPDLGGSVVGQAPHT